MLPTPAAPNRIIGFDLARAYAILGMFIVNFNFCFGSFQNNTPIGQFLNLFTGNSTAIFIICAGLSLSLLTNRAAINSHEQRQRIKSRILKRSWFLVVIGLLLYPWWPGDILHFYGGYMHIAAYLLFVPRNYYLLGAGAAIIIFHVLLLIIPINTSWDFATFKYADFWTVQGFLRNTLYNGWNSLFPWIAYFLLGMWLGRINWQDGNTRRNVFLTGLVLFALVEGIRKYAVYAHLNRQILNYIMYDYFPPYLPFMIITASFALMIITACLWLGERFGAFGPVQWLAALGRMTLTNYVLHITLGMLVLQALTGRKYTGLLQMQTPVSPEYILLFSLACYGACVAFSALWSHRFSHGPLEALMRKIAG